MIYVAKAISECSPRLQDKKPIRLIDCKLMAQRAKLRKTFQTKEIECACIWSNVHNMQEKAWNNSWSMQSSTPKVRCNCWSKCRQLVWQKVRHYVTGSWITRPMTVSTYTWTIGVNYSTRCDETIDSYFWNRLVKLNADGGYFIYQQNKALLVLKHYWHSVLVYSTELGA